MLLFNVYIYFLFINIGYIIGNIYGYNIILIHSARISKEKRCAGISLFLMDYFRCLFLSYEVMNKNNGFTLD